MAAGDFLSRIRGTAATLFRLGKGGPQLKNNSGVVELRSTSDGAFVIGRVLDPVGNDDMVNLRYFNANNAAATGLTIVKMPLAQATKVSTSAIPDNAIIMFAILDVTTLYDAGATVALKRTGDPTVIPMAVADSDMSIVATYHVPQTVSWGTTGTGTLTATVANSPTVGASVIYIGYVTPTDIS